MYSEYAVGWPNAVRGNSLPCIQQLNIRPLMRTRAANPARRATDALDSWTILLAESPEPVSPFRGGPHGTGLTSLCL